MVNRPTRKGLHSIGIYAIFRTCVDGALCPSSIPPCAKGHSCASACALRELPCVSAPQKPTLRGDVSENTSLASAGEHTWKRPPTIFPYLFQSIRSFLRRNSITVDPTPPVGFGTCHQHCFFSSASDGGECINDPYHRPLLSYALDRSRKALDSGVCLPLTFICRLSL